MGRSCLPGRLNCDHISSNPECLTSPNTPDLPDSSGLPGTRLLMYSEDTIVHPLSETVPGVQMPGETYSRTEHVKEPGSFIETENGK